MTIADVSDLIEVKMMEMNPLEAERIWQKIRTQEEIFDDLSRNNAQMFAARMFAPTTLAFYNHAGLVMMENVIPGVSAAIHFVIWDSKYPEREIVEVGREVLREAFRRFKLHRVYANPQTFNKFAARIATKLGFKYEGTIREAWLHRGKWRDISMYGLLVREFTDRIM